MHVNAVNQCRNKTSSQITDRFVQLCKLDDSIRAKTCIGDDKTSATCGSRVPQAPWPLSVLPRCPSSSNPSRSLSSIFFRFPVFWLDFFRPSFPSDFISPRRMASLFVAFTEPFHLLPSRSFGMRMGHVQNMSSSEVRVVNETAFHANFIRTWIYRSYFCIIVVWVLSCTTLCSHEICLATFNLAVIVTECVDDFTLNFPVAQLAIIIKTCTWQLCR